MACIFYRILCISIYAFVCCADSFLLASSFSPRWCDLHAKVRAEILIGRAVLYKSTCRSRENREEGKRNVWERARESKKEKQRECNVERNNSLCSGIQCGPSETMADERKWQNNSQKWNSAGGRYRPDGEHHGHKAGNNCDSLYYGPCLTNEIPRPE